MTIPKYAQCPRLLSGLLRVSLLGQQGFTLLLDLTLALQELYESHGDLLRSQGSCCGRRGLLVRLAGLLSDPLTSFWMHGYQLSDLFFGDNSVPTDGAKLMMPDFGE